MSSEQRKVLEDIQRAKRLLKEGAAASLGIHTTPTSAASLMSPTTAGFQVQQSPAGIGDIMLTPGMRSAMQVLAQANVSSFGYFVPQDSHFGNSILPVLPRIDPPVAAQSAIPGAAGSAPSSTPSTGNGQQ